jgi:hypothetical protein
MSSVNIQIRIEKNPFKEVIESINSPEERTSLFRKIGSQVARKARDTARAKGGKNFWAQIASSVSYKANSEQVVVGASHYAAGHKETGGTISAPGKGAMSRGRKYLSIPISPVSYGKSPGDFNGLFKIVSKAGNLLLFRKAGDGIEPLFCLKKSVFQKAYPWFPKGEELNGEIKKAIDSWMKKNKGV